MLRDVCFRNYIDKTENSLKSNPKYFWNYFKNKKNQYDLPSVMHCDDVTANNSNEVVNLFASFFSSVYSTDMVNHIPDYNYLHNRIDISCYSVSLTELIDKLLHAPNKLSVGPDGIPLYVLKKCIFTLATPLHKIFNLSLHTGIFPEFWKNSFLTPIHKSGPRNDIKNYRAICIQSEIPKLLDCLVASKISWDTAHIINSQQHGFMSKKSTTTNLILYEHFLLNAFERQSQVDSIYTDFTKAFDRVNHILLIAKLKALGVEGCVLKWIQSYLSNRTQFVRYSGAVSPSIMVTSGVPQGSHIGPILFNLFVNDITENFANSKCLMFADDLKLFRIINNTYDALSLQNDLNNLSLWCDANLLKLNPAKCNQISFTRSNNPIIFEYHFNNATLNKVNLIKDLGVLFDQKMTFKSHILKITSQALKVLGCIHRDSSFFSIETYKLLYSTLVRSILEYSSVVWNPVYDVDKESIEKVQSKFLRQCAFMMGRSRGEYCLRDILTELNLMSLEHRRVQLDLCFLHKIINGYTNCPELLQLISFNLNERRTRNTELFKIPSHHTNYGQNECVTRLLRTANMFYKDIELFDTALYSFKNQVRSCISSSYY